MILYAHDDVMVIVWSMKHAELEQFKIKVDGLRSVI